MKTSPLAIMLLLLAGACGSRSGNDNPEGRKVNGNAMYEDASYIDDERRPEHTPLPLGNLSRYTGQEYAEVFNDSNYIQYERAEILGIDPIHDLRGAYHTRRPLVKIESNGDYAVDHLTHSMPFLVPEAARLLTEIGRDFKAKTKANGGSGNDLIIVTSVLRSPYSVKKLRRVNRNAVDSSTHMFATTFDISYNNFQYADSATALPPGKLKQILADVLHAKRKEGKCLVKYEVKSPCFHITVNKNL